MSLLITPVVDIHCTCNLWLLNHQFINVNCSKWNMPPTILSIWPTGLSRWLQCDSPLAASSPTMVQMAEDEVMKRSGSARVLHSILGVFRTLPTFTASRSSHLARLSVPACFSASASCTSVRVLTTGAVLGFRSEGLDRSFNPHVRLRS